MQSKCSKCQKSIAFCHEWLSIVVNLNRIAPFQAFHHTQGGRILVRDSAASRYGDLCVNFFPSNFNRENFLPHFPD